MTPTRPGRLLSFVGTLVTLGWHVSRVVVVVAALILLIAPWVDPPRIEIGLASPVALTLDDSAHAITPAPPGAERVFLGNLQGTLHFSPRSRAAVVGAALALGLGCLLAAWLFGELKALIGSLRAGTPFVAANARRIRRIGYAILTLAAADAAATWASSRYAAGAFTIDGARFHAVWSVNVFLILTGLVILVLAQVFREGTRLTEDESLTI